MTYHTMIPKYTETDNVTGCCPVFHPEAWDNQIFDFKDYVFIKEYSSSIMHIPLNLGAAMTKAQKAIDQSHQAYLDQYLILSKDLSPWKTEHYFLVKGEVEGYPLEKIEGNYLAKVYDGPFKDMSKWIKSYMDETHAQGLNVETIFMFYTTCPQCAKTYGHNYVVILGKIQ